jgi:hypothetical protein
MGKGRAAKKPALPPSLHRMGKPHDGLHFLEVFVIDADRHVEVGTEIVIADFVNGHSTCIAAGFGSRGGKAAKITGSGNGHTVVLTERDKGLARIFEVGLPSLDQ